MIEHDELSYSVYDSRRIHSAKHGLIDAQARLDRHEHHCQACHKFLKRLRQQRCSTSLQILQQIATLKKAVEIVTAEAGETKGDQ